VGKTETVTSCTFGYGWQEGDIIKCHDGSFIVTKIVSGTTLEMRRWTLWERVRYAVKRVWSYARRIVGIAKGKGGGR
jgi:hypothetical protein